MLTSTVEHALRYAKRGWRVLPTWWITDERQCACGSVTCTAPGKHPLITMGQGMQNASRDPDLISDWWDRWPQANVAVAAGELSGITVLDLDLDFESDPPKWGETALLEFAQQLDATVPDTLTAETPRGGRHLFFQTVPNVKNLVGWLEGVDVRSAGGYVLVAPSNHISGKQYQWLNDLPVAELPSRLADQLRIAKPFVRRVSTDGSVVPPSPSYRMEEAIERGPWRGIRDHFFNAYAYVLRVNGTDYAQALELMREAWFKADQAPDDPFPWESAQSKLDRVWSTVEPGDPNPDWVPGRLREAPDPSPDQDAIPSEDLTTDLGNALRMAIQNRDRLRYTNELGWLVWDGARWKPDALDAATHAAALVGRVVTREAELADGMEDRQSLAQWAHSSRMGSHIKHTERLARTVPMLVAELADFDREALVIVTNSGELDLRTGQVTPPERASMHTLLAPVEYAPYPDLGEDRERWEWFLDTVTQGDRDLQSYLQRASGYSLTGLTLEESLFMLTGPQASGKSTFMDALMAGMGEYATVTPPDTFAHRLQERAPGHELAAFRGKRLVATIELDDSARLVEGTVKSVTSGDLIQARLLYKERFTFRPAFKLWFATNHKPQVRDQAIWRRIREVPFSHSIPPEQRQPRVKEWARDPQRGGRTALSWAVEGAKAWLTDGLGTCEAVRSATAEYQQEQDVFGQFLIECCDQEPTAEDTAARLYDRYVVWVGGRGERPMSQTAFGRKLRERGFGKSSRAPFTYYGLRVRARGEEVRV